MRVTHVFWSTHRVTRDDRREDRCIHDPQVGYPVHTQTGVDDTALGQRAHSRRTSGVVQRLGARADILDELLVARVCQPMSKVRIRVAVVEDPS